MTDLPANWIGMVHVLESEHVSEFNPNSAAGRLPIENQFSCPATMGRLQWTEEELRGRRKGDQKKVRIARRLRAETTMTLKWIAAALWMGSWTHVSNLLSSAKQRTT